jgi:uncharacterized protein YdaL
VTSVAANGGSSTPTTSATDGATGNGTGSVSTPDAGTSTTADGTTTEGGTATSATTEPSAGTGTSSSTTPSSTGTVGSGAGAGIGGTKADASGNGSMVGTADPSSPPPGVPDLLASALGTGPKTLVLYDAPAGEWQRLGFSYAIMLRNLLGHFDARVDLVPVNQYAAGRMKGYDATFYLGAAYDTPLPAAFIADAAASTSTLVWFKYNLWDLANDPAYQFTATRGISLTGLRGMNAVPSAANPNPGFFDRVTYKGKDFVKYYAWDGARNVINADPDVGVTAIADPALAKAEVMVTNSATGEKIPYITRSGKFWYVADIPFSFIGPRDRYLVLCDLLHDMLGVQHAESHRAMVRLEDVDAKVSASAMTRLTDYLSGKGIPFSIATIPHYIDPTGIANDGVPQDIPFAKATNLKKVLDYAQARGGEIVMHGYTHQYGAMKNPWTGVSGDDYEFWNIVDMTPVAEDSTPWAFGRLNAGLTELTEAGYKPIAWEMPHYWGSALSSKAVPRLFNTTYQRVVYFTSDKPDFSPHAGKDFFAGQIFPYVIQRDYYNQRVLPESLGNIEYDISKIDPSSNLNYSWQDIYLNAQYALTVRDGFASFFFHPFWLESSVGQPGFADFRSLVEGISGLGYTWVAPSRVQ